MSEEYESMLKKVNEMRRQAARELQTRIAKYGDGKIVYFNGEAVVPMSAVLDVLRIQDK